MRNTALDSRQFVNDKSDREDGSARSKRIVDQKQQLQVHLASPTEGANRAEIRNYGPEDRGPCCRSWAGIKSLCSEQIVRVVPGPVVVARSTFFRASRAEPHREDWSLPERAGDPSRLPEGRREEGLDTLLPNIDEILIDRVDAYRLHRREKEASNYLGRDTNGSPVRG